MGDSSHMADADRRRALKADLARFNCRVSQPDDPPLFTAEPMPLTQTVHWRWTDLMPLLDRLGQDIDLDAKGPRRTIRLQNPGLAYGTTTTFWGSIQVILPGEVATAHRHSASALRFIIQGSGATTTVDGECYAMNEGDLVLNPPGSWHDHAHHGTEPMIWLDVLDISLMRMLQATFFEGYHRPEQDISTLPDRSWRAYGSGLMGPLHPTRSDGANPLPCYGQAMSRGALEQARGLDPDPCDDVILEYRNPVDGGPAMRTMGMTLQCLRAGFDGRRRRHTGSKLFYVVEGSGTTTLDDREIQWSRGDFVTIAPWAWHAHRNGSGSDAVLFQVNDFPAMKALGYYREEVRP